MLRVVHIEVCDPFLGCPASGGRDGDRRRQPVCGSEGRCPGEGSTPRFFQRCLARMGKCWWIRKGAELPDRCLKCAAPARGYRFSRSLSWHKPVWALTFLMILILYAHCLLICAMAGASHGGPLSSPPQEPGTGHRPGLARSPAGLGSIIAGGMVSDSLQPIALIGGIVLLFVGMICGGRLARRCLSTRRIDKHFVWLSKVSPDYLAAFPDWSAEGTVLHDARPVWIPNARRMGAARGDLDRLASQPRRLAWEVRPRSLGLHRDRPPSQPRRDRVASWLLAAR